MNKPVFSMWFMIVFFASNVAIVLSDNLAQTIAAIIITVIGAVLTSIATANQMCRERIEWMHDGVEAFLDAMDEAGKEMEKAVKKAEKKAERVAEKAARAINNVRELRLDKGWSQKYLGQLIGVGQGTVSNVETGRYKVCEEVKDALAAALEVSASKLFPNQ